MLIIKKATLKKSVFFIVSLAFLVLMVALLAPSGVSFADADTGPNCVDDSIVSDDEDCSCKDVVCEEEPWNETAASACGTFPTVNNECPEGLSEFGGVCWDACECEGLCTEEDIEEAKKAGGGGTAEDNCSTYSIADQAVSGYDEFDGLRNACNDAFGGDTCTVISSSYSGEPPTANYIVCENR